MVEVHQVKYQHQRIMLTQLDKAMHVLLLWPQIVNIKPFNISQINLELPLLFRKVFLPDGRWLKNRTGRRPPRNYRYYRLDKVSLPAGDLENIVRNLIQGFLNSDMNKLPDEKRLAFKQCEYSDDLLKEMIEKIVYNEHKINTFIKIGNIDHLKNFQKQDYMNTTNEPLKYYITTDEQYAVIETPLYFSTGTCINQRNGGLEVELLTMNDNA